MKRVIADIDENLHHQFKMKTLVDKKTIKDVLLELVKRYIKGEIKLTGDKEK